MIHVSFKESETLPVSFKGSSNIPISLQTGIPISGSIVIPNPEDTPTEDLETVKINSETFRIKDGQLSDWAREETKPVYNAEEVGAVDADNELHFSEIDNMFNAVFGI